MTKKCPDCKGGGTYQGFNTKPEPCSKCHGLGKVDTDKKDALESVFNFNNPEGKSKMDSLLSKIVVGTPIYVYDAGWHEAFVMRISCNPNDSADLTKTYIAKSACDTFNIPHRGVTFNITQNRWEFIKCGTPVWH